MTLAEDRPFLISSGDRVIETAGGGGRSRLGPHSPPTIRTISRAGSHSLRTGRRRAPARGDPSGGGLSWSALKDVLSGDACFSPARPRLPRAREVAASGLDQIGGRLGAMGVGRIARAPSPPSRASWWRAHTSR